MQLYKVLAADASAFYGGNGKWHKPRGKRPGKWMPPINGELQPCRNGYHLCRAGDLVAWLGPTIWRAEHEGELLEGNDKVVVRRARLIEQLNWNDKVARSFACDCALRVLPIFEKHHPGDQRPREAIRVARRFARAKATRDELEAAWAAARAAAREAARGAASAAARAAAWEAASAAAREAAWAAASAAAREAAWAAERKKQTRRLFMHLTTE